MDLEVGKVDIFEAKPLPKGPRYCAIANKERTLGGLLSLEAWPAWIETHFSHSPAILKEISSFLLIKNLLARPGQRP
jgi:hypothetical protein